MQSLFKANTAAGNKSNRFEDESFPNKASPQKRKVNLEDSFGKESYNILEVEDDLFNEEANEEHDRMEHEILDLMFRAGLDSNFKRLNLGD